MKYNFNERIDRSENHSAKWAEMEMKFGRSDLIPMWVADMDIKAAPEIVESMKKKVEQEIFGYVYKWAEMEMKFGRSDLIPMWVADMDIKAAPEIVESMKKKVEQEIFGYVYRPDSYYKTATEWLKKRFGYEISPSSLIHSPGVVPSMSILVKMLTKNSDKILIQTPVYPPFASAVKDNGRELVENPLIKDEKGYYTIDFEDLEKKLSLDEVKLLILCNPHNPVGRVWKKEELLKMGELCKKYNVRILADEIWRDLIMPGLLILCNPHNPVGRVWKKEELLKMGELCKKYNVRILADEIWRDLIMPGYKHTPMASLSKDIEDITITLFSPTKSFNLAGLQASFVTFPRAEERKEFDNILGQMDVKRNNPFSLVAFETAYEKCEDWLEELILHIDGNMQYVVDFIAEKLPEIKVVKPEGTYLMWLDFNGTNKSSKTRGNLFNVAGF